MTLSDLGFRQAPLGVAESTKTSTSGQSKSLTYPTREPGQT